MDRFLPWVAIGAGVLALALARSTSQDGRGKAGTGTSTLLACLVGLVVVYAAAFGFRSQLIGLIDVAHGIAIGAAAVLAATWFTGGAAKAGLAAIGIATAIAGVILLLPPELRQSLWLGAAMGSGLAAACTCLADPKGSLDRLAAFTIAAFSGASALGGFRDGVERAAAMPAVIGIVAVIALSAIQYGSLSKWLKWAAVAVVLVGGAKLIAIRYLFLGASFDVALGSIATAAMVAWILDTNADDTPGPFVICTIIWLAWSTIAFGLLQGLGLAVSAVFAAAFLLAVGSYRGLLSMGVLVALLFYRIFLEAYPTESRHIDVGQHYSVMGIIAGAALPIAVASWVARAGSRFEGFMRPGMALLAGAIFVAVLIAAHFILGARGTIGLLVGLSIAPFVAGLAKGGRLGILAAIGGMAAAIVVSFKFAAPHLLMERETKIQMLGWSIAVAVILTATAHWLTRDAAGAATNENTT
ncbi:MAG: hypothetical protein M3R13_02270 [Armatimonadota bacterium]|nr:hypothetical protein [Armatimonadota bacterium]